MRVFCFTLAVLAFAILPTDSPAQAPPDSASSVVSKQTGPDQPTLAIAAAVSQPAAPAHDPTLPVAPIAIAMAAVAAKRGRKKGDVPLITDSHIDVMREDKKGSAAAQRIPPGKLVEQTDLTDEEVEELTARKAIRPATPEELTRLEQGDVEEERATLLREQEGEIAQLRAKHEAELSDESLTSAKRSKLEDRQASEISKLQAEHAKALAKLDAE